MSLSLSELKRFADRYQRAIEVAQEDFADRGTSGLELEWNLLDTQWRPLERVGTGLGERSFIDAFIEDHIPPWLAGQCQREVFHWMIEWATQPHYSVTGTVYEARILEGLLYNALAAAGVDYGKRLFAYHGNLLQSVKVDENSVPEGWDLAKRRYLQRCVELYGEKLATAGTHANVSLPEPLLNWDFIHLPPSRRKVTHLDGYRNNAYIEGARILRAFTSLFIATSASTPLQPKLGDDGVVVEWTDFDSVRNLTFPNPVSLDVPGLYSSHERYIAISYNLVRCGIRFGNNNWTPTRARSLVEPVERLIAITSEQLNSLYREGLYVLGQTDNPETIARDIEIQNLLARVDIPMARVEIRMDDGGNPMDLEIANLALKELLLTKIYADQEYMRDFRYDEKDLDRARRNERRAAAMGLRAEIEHPLTGTMIPMREFLTQTLADIHGLSEAIGRAPHLIPLDEMARGGPNTAELIRRELRSSLGDRREVPLEALQALAERREQEVASDLERVAMGLPDLELDGSTIQDLLLRGRQEARRGPHLPIRFTTPSKTFATTQSKDKVSEILELARQLIRLPSVSMAAQGPPRWDEITHSATFIRDYLHSAGLQVELYEDQAFPAVFACFPGSTSSDVMLCGHFDVVPPEPDSVQFEPRVEGDYLWGRGAADMKTVVATYMVWMKDCLRSGESPPPLSLLLIGNEETGEKVPYGTPHVLNELKAKRGIVPQLLIAGERTGEQGDERVGNVCTANRGLLRVEFHAAGNRGHTGVKGARPDLTTLFTNMQVSLMKALAPWLNLDGADGWQSQVRFPYVLVGERGIYNISAGQGVMGVEVRTIPDDDVDRLLEIIDGICRQVGWDYQVDAAENGVTCDPVNPHVVHLLEAVAQVSKKEAKVGRKLPATSARFAPAGQGVVWGQSGIGPHTANERHYIPSIEPYYQILQAYAKRLQPGSP